jgi:radical SAM-linked protein
MSHDSNTKPILVLIKFRVQGVLRFISHAEMLKVFQRACARAGIKIQHSQGFNPHPKLSLPLPRPVGVESDDELLCIRMNENLNESQIKTMLSAQLPEGCELLSVSFTQTAKSIQPCAVTYLVPVQPECINDKLRARVENLLSSESLIIERRIDAKKSKIKMLDVRPFLESIKFDNKSIVVDCRVTPAGSVRIGEILELLEIGVEELAAPVRRTNLQWQAA